MKRFFQLLLAITAVACKPAPVTEKTARKPVVADSAMVVSAHPLASQTGIDVLRQGGNAIDAAIAVQFTLAVVYPAAGNIGGGGFMVIRMNDGKLASLDYREKAPSSATMNMFLDETGSVVDGLSTSTHLASGVPGSVAGLWEAYQKFGTLPWSDLVQPAIEIARNGFALTAREAQGLNSIHNELIKNNTTTPESLVRESWHAGDTVRLYDLAHTLELIRDHGPAGFYEGETAQLIVDEMHRGRGIMSLSDLKAYKPVWRDLLIGHYKDLRIISMGPPSSGGIGLLQLLKSIEPFAIASWQHNSERTVHLFTEAQRRVYADRATYLGDPDFVSNPVSYLLDSMYIARRMSNYDPDRATPSRQIREGTNPAHESAQTTHLSVVDAFGNAVAATTTLNDSYGSKVMVAGAGFLLNNEMDDFSAKPGSPNMYGAVGGEANKIVGNKRMLSSMTPTIVEKNGDLFMVLGTPGGTTIITSVFQTLVNVVEFKMDMQQAVDARRVHSQWLPDQIDAESSALSQQAKKELERRGHVVVPREDIGQVDAILVNTSGKLEGGADSRGDDTALGY